MIWPPDEPGVVELPSGRRVRGRSWRAPVGLEPEHGWYFVHRIRPEPTWPHTFVPWRDFQLPTDRRGFRPLLTEILERSATERVEVSCVGGKGRTGTALACLAVLDGVPPREAVAWVREHYRPEAVEMPWQSWYVRWFR